MSKKNKGKRVPQVVSSSGANTGDGNMTKGKRGRKKESGDTSQPECFGYFINPIGNFERCSKCKLMKECFTRWKDMGEPRRPGTSGIPLIREETRCKNCEGI